MADKINPAVIAHGFAQVAGGNADDYLARMTGIAPDIKKQQAENAWQAAKQVSPLSVGGRIAASETAFGIPEMIANKTMSDDDKARWEMAKEAHPIASTVGKVLGTGANMAGIAGIEALTAGAATPAVAAAKAAQIAGKTGKFAETAAKLPWLRDALKQAGVGVATAVPHAVGTAVLGEGDTGENIGQAATELLLGGGLGAAGGAIPKGILPAIKRSNSLNDITDLAGTGGRGKNILRQKINRIAPIGEADKWIEDVADIVDKGKKEFGMGKIGFGGIENEQKFIKDLGEKSGQRFEEFYKPLKEKGYKPNIDLITEGKVNVDPITGHMAETGTEQSALSALDSIENTTLKNKIYTDIIDRSDDPSELNKYITSLQKNKKPDVSEAGRIMRNNFHSDLDDFAKKSGVIDSKELQSARKQYAQYKLLEDLSKRKLSPDYSDLFLGSPTAPATAISEGDFGKALGAAAGKAIDKTLKPLSGKIMDLSEKPLEFIGKHPAMLGRLAPAIADESGLTEKQTVPTQKQPWYANPKAGQAIIPALQQKYQLAMNSGIYPQGFTFEQFVERARKKTNDFDPRRVAKWIYKDPIERSDFLKQVEESEKLKNIDIEKVATYKPKALKSLMEGLSKIPLVGGAAGMASSSNAKDNYDAMVGALAHKVGGEKQAKIMLKQLLKSNASPTEKKALILKMFGLGEDSYVAQMGIV